MKDLFKRLRRQERRAVIARKHNLDEKLALYFSGQPWQDA